MLAQKFDEFIDDPPAVCGSPVSVQIHSIQSEHGLTRAGEADCAVDAHDGSGQCFLQGLGKAVPPPDRVSQDLLPESPRRQRAAVERLWISGVAPGLIERCRLKDQSSPRVRFSA